jgi:hypothetical protein
MGKITISMAIFNSYVTNYQRVYQIKHFMLAHFYGNLLLVLQLGKNNTVRKEKR